MVQRILILLLCWLDIVYTGHLMVTMQYSGFWIIRILIIRILDYPKAWTSPCFRQQREKDVLVTGVLLQEKANLLYERLFPDATTPFSASMGPPAAAKILEFILSR